MGAADDILAHALKIEDVRLHTRTRQLLHSSFSLLKNLTAHPYALLLPQTITEQCLAEKLSSLGIRIHRPYKVVGLRQNAKDSETGVLFEDGQVMSAKYVIGADGARSTVRTRMVPSYLLSAHKRINAGPYGCGHRLRRPGRGHKRTWIVTNGSR